MVCWEKKKETALIINYRKKPPLWMSANPFDWYIQLYDESICSLLIALFLDKFNLEGLNMFKYAVQVVTFVCFNLHLVYSYECPLKKS